MFSLATILRRSLPAVVLLLALAPRVRATEVPDRQNEADLNRRRAEWIESIHRAAPGTNWRDIEAADRLETMWRLQSAGARSQSVGWTERGAANLTGRNFDCARTSSGQLLIGSANGGLFRGTVSSGTWTPLTDNLGYGVQHVLVAPGSPDRILIADNSRLFYSADGGASWAVPTGLPDYVWRVVRLVQEANAPLTMYALVDGWIWTGSDWDHNWHLLRSVDGGASFTRIHTEPNATRPDVWISRIAAGPLYMAVGNVLQSSTDHGVTWSVIGSLPAAGLQVWLAGSEAGAPHFYCTLYDGSSWTLYGSADAGVSWTTLASPGGFYDTIAASITDQTQVFLGGVNCMRSINGGVIFNAINQWYDYYGNMDRRLHADIFGIRCLMEPISPGSGTLHEVIYLHTDGGTFTYDPSAGGFATNVTRFGFRNSQYYGSLTNLANPSEFSAGAQDQGFQISNAGLGTVTPNLTQQISGDYAHLVSSWPDHAQMIWSVYPGFVLVQTGPGGAPALETTNFPSGAPGFQFLPATSEDPNDPYGVYVGARQLWHVHRDAPGTYTWTAQPQDFDHGDGDVVGAIGWAPSDHLRGYIATYRGRIWTTTNGGGTWTESAFTGPPSHYFAGSSIVVSPTNPLAAWVGGSGYSNPGVFVTSDGGASWAGMAAGLPSTQVYAIALENPLSGVLYAATQAGPFRWNGSSWDNLLLTSCCAPLTDYWSVESIPHRGLVRFSTYGRGIWDYATGATLAAPAPRAARSLELAVAPNPAAAGTRVSLALAAAGVATVEVFDVQGHRVRTLASGWRPAGSSTLDFDGRTDRGRPLDAGVYLVRATTPGGIAVTRLAIAR